MPEFEEPTPEIEIKGPMARISEILLIVSAIALFIMMLLSIADICGRYFFLKPIQGTTELVGILLVVTSSLGLGWCQYLKGNITIDLLPKRLGPKGQAVLSIISYLLSIAVCVIISWQATLMMTQYIIEPLGGTTATLHIVIWPFILIMTGGFIWVTVVFIQDLYNSFKEVFKK
jgi:TRAP-type C4-dicarboxylate transport system permease small subunit